MCSLGCTNGGTWEQKYIGLLGSESTHTKEEVKLLDTGVQVLEHMPGF